MSRFTLAANLVSGLLEAPGFSLCIGIALRHTGVGAYPGKHNLLLQQSFTPGRRPQPRAATTRKKRIPLRIDTPQDTRCDEINGV